MDRRKFLYWGAGGMATCLGSRFAHASALPLLKRLNPEQTLHTIAFGSCNDSTKDQAYWRLIARDRPDLWLWLGDIIYADRLSMQQRAACFRTLAEDPDYASFAAATPIFGTWDDHDYAHDNADGSWPAKRESQVALLDFLQVPPTEEVWKREGVYQSYTYGLEGRQTQIILLDLRYHMNKARGHLLGEEQWAWLEDELAQSKADLRIIGSSLNVTSPITGAGLEGWNEYRAERQRLYDLLDVYSKPTIILSGDRHFAEMSCALLPSGQRVYEFMSSGLTHALGIKFPHPGRLEEMVGRKNYGLLEIDWFAGGPVVRMQIKSTEKYAVYREHTADFS